MGKVIITGPGRSGSSFLVRLLTWLGEDTGFEKGGQTGYSDEVRAGCEQQVIVQILDGDIVGANLAVAPRVLKSPDWAFVLKNLVRKGWMEVDHVLIPFRDLELTAESRLDVGLDWMLDPGGSHELRVAAQANIHGLALGRTMEACWVCGLRYTVLMFPLFVQSADYCYERLSRAFALERGAFDEAFTELARPEMIRWT